MPFDVTMPDGTMIQGVPDGTTKAQLAQKYQSHIGSAPAVPAPEGAAPADYANATDPTKTWLSQHPGRAGSLSHVVGESYRGLKEGFGDAPLAAPVPDWISKNVPNAIPVAAAYQLGNLGLRSLGGIMGGIYGAAKGEGEVLGMDPTQARKFGGDIEEMPLSTVGVSHTISRMPRNPVRPGVFEDFAARTAASPVNRTIKTVAQKTAELLTPGRVGNRIVSTVGSNALSSKDKAAQQVLADALAENERITKGLSEAAGVPAAPASIGIGEAKDVSDIAGAAQRNIFTTQQAEKEATEAARKYLQGLEQDAVDLNEAAGKPFVETAGVQEILKKAAPFKNFDPATAPTLLPTSDRQTRSLYRLVHDALANKEFSYVDPITKETITRTFNNSFSAASDLRRFLGQAFNKETGGYGAIKKSIQTDLYDLLNKAENEYTAGTSQAWKDNYSRSKQSLERFEENPLVSRVIKTYGTEGKPVMTPAQFANVLTSGDRTQIDDLFEATADKLRPQLRQSIADAIETKFSGANYDTFVKEMAPGGRLSDQLKHPELASFKPQIENYMTRLKDAETAGVTAEKLLLKVPTARKAVATAGTEVRKIETGIKEFNDLSKLSPDKALDAAYKHITDVREAGGMTKAEYDAAYDQLSKAKRLLGITPTMRTKVIGILKNTVVKPIKLVPGIIGTAAGIGGATYYLNKKE